MARPVRILGLQGGPMGTDRQENLRQSLELLDQGVAEHGPVDFAVFGELATVPYFCGTEQREFLSWAEPIPGPTTIAFSEAARKHNCNILIGFYEQGTLTGERYNSAVLIDRKGSLIPGKMPNGQTIKAYRKCHVADVVRNDVGSAGSNEKFYFRPGPGLAVFETDMGKVGVLICYDRTFPEAWRVLALQGAEMVFVTVASCRTVRSDSFLLELRMSAMQNNLFVAAINKGGLEDSLDAPRQFFGNSAVIDPTGTVLAQAPFGEGPATLAAEIDLDFREEHATRFYNFRDRRPELYTIIGSMTSDPQE